MYYLERPSLFFGQRIEYASYFNSICTSCKPIIACDAFSINVANVVESMNFSMQYFENANLC